jgi:hypothetical protein
VGFNDEEVVSIGTLKSGAAIELFNEGLQRVLARTVVNRERKGFIVDRRRW